MHGPIDTNPTMAERIDDLCDAFEAVWLRQRPQIAAFVLQGLEVDRPVLFSELLLVDLEYRRKLGEEPLLNDYVHEFPGFVEQIEATFFKHATTALNSTAQADEDTVRNRTHRQGEWIAHFELIEWLGAGAMGEVWKARDTRLQRNVAIKLPRAKALAEAGLHRFLREGRAAVQLRHPRLASVHEVGRDGDNVYIVATYVEGVNLREYRTAHSPSFTAMAELCANVADALHHAHEHGITHRDVKPANIIVDRNNHPHVIDFGLAKWSDDERDITLHGELLGTPAYMSPEQASGNVKRIDRTTDVYALGAVLYEMLTDQPPFVGDRASVIHQILCNDPKAPRKLRDRVPRDLDTICVKALAKEPERRYPTAQEMAVDLQRFVRGEPILSRHVGVVGKCWRWVRRRPAMAACLILATLATVMMIVAGSLAQRNRKLQGYQSVTLRTEPPGARVAFVPINEIGELLVEQVVRPPGVTPVTTELLSGEYFMEVVLPDGRFHQVIRRVPIPGKPIESTYAHQSWKIDQANIVQLSILKIPGDDVSQDMLRANARLSRNGVITERSFFFDRMAHVIGNKVAIGKFGLRELDLNSTIAMAEREGKRLPTDIEYDWLNLATDGNTKPELTLRPGHRERIRVYSPETAVNFVRTNRPWFLEVPK